MLQVTEVNLLDWGAGPAPSVMSNGAENACELSSTGLGYSGIVLVRVSNEMLLCRSDVVMMLISTLRTRSTLLVMLVAWSRLPFLLGSKLISRLTLSLLAVLLWVMDLNSSGPVVLH